MNNFEMVTRNPDVLALFLDFSKDQSLPPWEAYFRRQNCRFCQISLCDLCPNEPEVPDERTPCPYREGSLDTIRWYLRQETDNTTEIRELANELTDEAARRMLRAEDERTTRLMSRAANALLGLLK